MIKDTEDVGGEERNLPTCLRYSPGIACFKNISGNRSNLQKRAGTVGTLRTQPAKRLKVT